MFDLDNFFEKSFKNIDESAVTIQNELEITYLEALTYVGEFLFQGELTEPISEVANKKIENMLAAVPLNKMSKEEIRKTFQLAILKGMKEATQPHHAMTPDTVAMFIGYLVEKLTEKKAQLRLLDPAVGSANLLTAVLNHSSKRIDSYGIEPDETLLQLAYVNANLQEQQVELFHQDSLTEIFADPMDIVICDLPVGYYPNEEVAKRYNLKADKGMSYTHHLIIEQALNYTKDGGFLIFVVPNFIFESEQASQLHAFIKDHAIIYSLFQLPKTMFKNENQAKSIFVIRKKGQNLKVPSQALLAELPSFLNKTALSEMMKSIENWLEAYIQ